MQDLSQIVQPFAPKPEDRVIEIEGVKYNISRIHERVQFDMHIEKAVAYLGTFPQEVIQEYFSYMWKKCKRTTIKM